MKNMSQGLSEIGSGMLMVFLTICLGGCIMFEIAYLEHGSTLFILPCYGLVVLVWPIIAGFTSVQVGKKLAEWLAPSAYGVWLYIGIAALFFSTLVNVLFYFLFLN